MLMKIFDCTTPLNQNLLIEVRLKILTNSTNGFIYL